MRVLIVEDELKMAGLVRRGLDLNAARRRGSYITLDAAEIANVDRDGGDRRLHECRQVDFAPTP